METIVNETVSEILNFGDLLDWNGKALYVNDWTESELLKACWERLYIRFKPGNLVIFSNIYLVEEIQSCGIFTEVISLLQSYGYEVQIECPEPRLAKFCDRNGIYWYS